MALNKATIKTSMQDAFENELSGGITSDQLAAIERVAGKLADAIDVFVKSGTYTINSGIPISLTRVGFPPTVYTGATTANATATVS